MCCCCSAGDRYPWQGRIKEQRPNPFAQEIGRIEFPVQFPMSFEPYRPMCWGRVSLSCNTTVDTSSFLHETIHIAHPQ